MPYLTPAEFREKPFGIPLRQYSDEMLEDYIEIASANVDAFCERHFGQATYTEVFRGDGSNTHLVYQYPIISVTSLAEQTIEDTPVTSSYPVSTGLIRTTNNDSVGRIELNGLDDISAFSPANLYTLVYVGGYATIPAVVKHATALWVSELLKPDYGGAQETVPEIVPITNQQIADLLVPIRRRRI